MLPVRCHKLKQRASTLKPVSSNDEDEGLYAPTPKCFKSYLPLKQKLLTHTPSGRTPMCVSIPFLFLIIVILWRYLCFSLCILLWIFLRTFIKLYIYNLHKISMLCQLKLVEIMLIKGN
jgi:hypothetical protein